jgi:hypothetical protein
MLTGDFTSLDEPTDASRFAAIAVLPADGPDLSNLKDKLSPETQRES